MRKSNIEKDGVKQLCHTNVANHIKGVGVRQALSSRKQGNIRHKMKWSF
jgi:hypothetical protein